MAGNKYENELIRDIPLIEDLSGTSAEVEYDPHFAGEGRIKSFFGEVVRDLSGYRSLLASFENLHSYLDQTIEGEQISRVQMRAVVSQNVLEQIASSQLGDYVEAVMTFNHETSGPLALLYIAENTIDRWATESDETIANEILASVSKRTPKTIPELLDKPMQNGYQIGILDSLSNREDISQIVDETYELYQRFGWNDLEEVRAFLTGENRIFSALRDETGQIQAVAIALLEHATILDGGEKINISMAELTEASSNVSGIGAYAALSELLILELARYSSENVFQNGPIHLVYGESNTMSGAVQAIVNDQGRNRCSEIMEQYGFIQDGRLHQQVFIESHPNQTSPKNDLWPNFIDSIMLEEILSELSQGGSGEHYRPTL